MKTVVIYHRADFDGIFCREIARKFFGETAEYIGWDHGDAKLVFPKDVSVYVLDLSPECFETASIISEHLVWIDHHKSAIEKYPSTWPGYRIDGVAACRLTWQWFGHGMHSGNWNVPNPVGLLPDKSDYVMRQVEEPLAVRLAGEYDIWDKRDPNAELFQHGLRSQELKDLTWRLLLISDGSADGVVESLLHQGEALQYASTQQNASIIKAYGFTVKFEGLTFLACNHARFNSHLFTAGIRPEHDALLGFNYDGSNDTWRVSLYHAPGKEHHDLSLIAVKFGGGGHRGACGFRCKYVPFGTDNILK